MPSPNKPKLNPALRKRLIAASAGGTLAIAAALGAWFEGDGPTKKLADGSKAYLPYIDPVGILTVCRGVTGKDVIAGKRYTEAECQELEHKHLAIAEKAARRLFIYWDSYSMWTKAALIDWLYNLGEAKAAGSTLRAKFNSGNTSAGCDELLKWVKGRVKGQLVSLPGLVTRRDAEHEVCLERVMLAQ